MNKKAICVIGLLLLTGCGNSETATTSAATTATTTATTAKATTETTEKATTATLTDREAKNKDVENAAVIATAFNATLTDEEAFDEFYPMVAQGGFMLQPFDDGSFVFIFPDGAKSSKIEKLMRENIKNINPYFNYFASNWEPIAWAINVDQNFIPHVYVYTYTDDIVELSPKIDAKYK